MKQDSNRKPRTVQRSPNIMHEMLRSFVTLAKFLNLTHAVNHLGSTRQTVRRHIEMLQSLRGQKLLAFEDRQYVLTKEGEVALVDAEQILLLDEAWMRRDVRVVNGLTAVLYNPDSDVPYFSQQHSIDTIWKNGTPLIQKGLQSWVESKAQLEAPEFDAVRDYLLAYRRHNHEWLCVSIGENSSYATWLGWSWAKSAIGKPLSADPMASDADQYVSQSYESILRGGGLRIDHVYTKIARTHGGTPEPISYQRLILRCMFPNGEYALVTLVDRTNTVQIVDVNLEELSAM
ncbi:MAG: LysR family transcriptional regulator, partial [Anderseniella sp.]